MGNCNAGVKKYNIDVENSKGKSIINDENNMRKSFIHEGSILDLIQCYEKEDASIQIATSSDDKKISIINQDSLFLNNLYQPNYLEGHTKAINRIRSANNSIWSASRDLSIKQWHISDNKCLQTLSSAHTLNISALAISKLDNKYIYSGSRDYSVKGWDIETGQCNVEFSSPRNIVTVMECSPTDGNLLFQGSEDLCIRVWDVRESSKQPAIHLAGYVYFPLCMDIHNNGNIIATGCKGFNSVGCEVKFWDIRKTSEFLFESKGHSQDVTGCKFNKNNNCNILVSVSKDGSIFALDTNKLNPIDDNNSQTVTCNKISSYCIGKNISCIENIQSSKYNNDSEHYALGSSDGSISFISLKNRQQQSNEQIEINMEFQTDYTTGEYFSQEHENVDSI